MRTVKLTPTADTYVYEDEPTANYGTSSSVYVGEYNADSYWALWRWDLSSFPSNGVLSSAVQYFYVISVTGDVEWYINPISEDWSETTVNWGNKPGYLSTPYVSTGTFSSTGWHSVDITNIVRQWLNGSITNYGIYWREGVTSNNYLRVASREYPVTSVRPYLELTYYLTYSTSVNTSFTLDGNISTMRKTFNEISTPTTNTILAPRYGVIR